MYNSRYSVIPVQDIRLSHLTTVRWPEAITPVGFAVRRGITDRLRSGIVGNRRPTSDYRLLRHQVSVLGLLVGLLDERAGFFDALGEDLAQVSTSNLIQDIIWQAIVKLHEKTQNQ